MSLTAVLIRSCLVLKMNRFRCYVATIEGSKKASSRRESNPGHKAELPVLWHYFMTTGQPPTLTILSMQVLHRWHQLHTWQPLNVCLFIYTFIFSCLHVCWKCSNNYTNFLYKITAAMTIVQRLTTKKWYIHNTQSHSWILIHIYAPQIQLASSFWELFFFCLFLPGVGPLL